MREFMLRNSQRLLEVPVSEVASQQSTKPVDSLQCEQWCRPIQKQCVNITTLCGKIRVRRWVYECASGHCRGGRLRYRPCACLTVFSEKWSMGKILNVLPLAA